LIWKHLQETLCPLRLRLRTDCSGALQESAGQCQGLCREWEGLWEPESATSPKRIHLLSSASLSRLNITWGHKMPPWTKTAQSNWPRKYIELSDFLSCGEKPAMFNALVLKYLTFILFLVNL
jgi:hypothetical protein